MLYNGWPYRFVAIPTRQALDGMDSIKIYTDGRGKNVSDKTAYCKLLISNGTL